MLNRNTILKQINQEIKQYQSQFRHCEETIDLYKKTVQMARAQRSRKVSGRSGRRAKHRSHTHNIHKLLKCFDSKLSISAMAMNIMDSFVEDLLGRISSEASKLVQYAGKTTMNSDDIIAAAQLVITSPELRKNTIEMAKKTVEHATKNKNSTA